MEKLRKSALADAALEVRTEAFDIGLYNEISRSARLAEIALSSSEFNAKMEAGLIASDPEAPLKLSYTDELVDVVFDGNTGILAGIFNWKASVRSGRSSLVRMRAAYSIVYDNLFDANEKYALAYLAKVGRFATYPYFRGLFSTHAGAAGLTLPPLPSLRERVD